MTVTEISLQDALTLKEQIKTDNSPELKRLCVQKLRELTAWREPSAQKHLRKQDGIADLGSGDAEIRKRGAELLKGTTEVPPNQWTVRMYA